MSKCRSLMACGLFLLFDWGLLLSDGVAVNG